MPELEERPSTQGVAAIEEAPVAGRGSSAPDGIPTVSAAATAGDARVCRNCGALATTAFCGQCGQSMDDRPLTARGILSDLLEDQLSVNGSTLRTFSSLLRPGFLTQEYLRGRIVRYLAPFRLFLLSTTFFVVAAAFAMHRIQPRIVAQARAAIAREQARAAREEAGRPAKPFQLIKLPIDSVWVPRPLRGVVRPVLQKQARINALPIDRALPVVMRASLRTASYLMPLAVPAAAALLALVYWRRRRPFAEHVVFILHTHSFAFLVMAVGALAQILWNPLSVAADLVFLGYFFVALVRVYGDGWWRTVPRFVLLLGLYIGLLRLTGPFLQIALVALA